MSKIILRLDGPWKALSNFYPTPVMLAGSVFPSVENAFQAAKTLDTNARDRFIHCDPSSAKRYGRALLLRDDWECIKDDIMLGLVRQKFEPGSSLATFLLDTGDTYICEGNTWHDNYWGACLCQSCLHKPHENRLGHLLMKVREELQE